MKKWLSSESVRGFTMEDESGSVIVLVLMILALISMVGIASMDSGINESMMTRNDNLYRQNLHLAEAAALEGLQNIMMLPPREIDPTTTTQNWINNTQNWDGGDELDLNNWAEPDSSLNGDLDLMVLRNEQNSKILRYAFTGWTITRGSSLKTTQPVWRSGTIYGVYDSSSYGYVEVEIGIERRF